MKKVLFIGATNYDFKKYDLSRLEEKFLGLSRGVKPFILAKGNPFHVKKWNTEFYLFPSNLLLWPFFLIIGFWICLTKQIDTIVAQSPLIEGFTGSIIKRILKKELIVEMHGDWIEGPFLSIKRSFAFLQRKLVPVLARVSFRNADKIRGVANCLIEEAKKVVSDKDYFLFPTFSDLNIFLNEKNKRFDNFILFVGHLEKVKGIKYLIRAFSEIEKEFPDFKLVIIGKGSERQNLELMANQLVVKDKIEFKGKLSLKETKDIMKNCYCLVLPSLSEGLPRVLMEAMALEKPIIGSRVAGIPDLIKDNENGFLFEKSNSNELVKKLRVLLNNRDLAIKMGQKGKKIIENKFSNEKYIENYISMINA